MTQSRGRIRRWLVSREEDAESQKSQKSPGYRFWIPMLLSLAAIAFTGYQFYYANIRDVRRAYLSVVAAEHSFLEDRNKSVLAIKALVTNGGTTPVAIQQVVWTLSEHPDPNERLQRKLQWAYRPTSPVVVQGQSVEILDFEFACHDTINGDFDDVMLRLFRDVPEVLRNNVNFCVSYSSSLSVLVVDVKGDIHLSTIAAGYLGFCGGSGDGGMRSMLLGDFRNLPLKTVLLPTPKLEGADVVRRAWLPAHYCDFGPRATGVVDTTGWRFLSDSASADFAAWVDSSGVLIEP